MKSFCVAGVLLAVVLMLPALSQSPAFVNLGQPPEKIAKSSNACPIRVDLPLGKLFEDGSIYRSGKAAAIKCDGAYMSVVVVEHHPAARGLKPRIHPKAIITLPNGRDKLAQVKYWFMRGEEVLSIGEEEISADEGETSSENGADLWYDKEVGQDTTNLYLRIETTFVER